MTIQERVREVFAALSEPERPAYTAPTVALPNVTGWLRFGTPRWNLFTAVQNLNIELTDTPPGPTETGIADRLVFGDNAPSIAAMADGASTFAGGHGRVWIKQTARTPVRTAAHELAHVVLRHEDRINGFIIAGVPEHVRADWKAASPTKAAMAAFVTRHADALEPLVKLAYAMSEFEAEATACTVCAELGLPMVHESWNYLGQYIPTWARAEAAPVVSNRVADAAQTILDAGRMTLAVAA